MVGIGKGFYIITYSDHDVKRFWAKVDKSGDCWLWTAFTLKGYGKFSLSRVDGVQKNLRAHRMSWELHFGEIPEGLSVLHSCDTPGCVRPDHLFLGTHQDNMDDKVLKNRQYIPTGVLNASAKLDGDMVLCIRKYASLFTQKQLGEFFNVSRQTIGIVIHNIGWNHL